MSEIHQEQRSSVAITQNAKGEAQAAVKVYDPGDDVTDDQLRARMDTIRAEAVHQYQQAVRETRTAPHT
jgi:hypothetical protein